MLWAKSSYRSFNPSCIAYLLEATLGLPSIPNKRPAALEELGSGDNGNSQQEGHVEAELPGIANPRSIGWPTGLSLLRDGPPFQIKIGTR